MALIDAMQALARRVGIETRLREVGMAENRIDRLADAAMLQTRPPTNNPRELPRADAHAIYTAAR